MNKEIKKLNEDSENWLRNYNQNLLSEPSEIYLKTKSGSNALFFISITLIIVCVAFVGALTLKMI